MPEASSGEFGDGAARPVRTAGTDDPSVIDEMERLRRLLLGPEQHHLAEVHHRVEQLERQSVSAEHVGAVLPDAVLHSHRQDHALARALEPALEASLRGSVQRDPQPFADALFPIFGPAIRRSIREALRSFVDTVNQSVENSLSLRSVRWRLEAWRTGRSFSEVVLMHTLQYRVEQVFLIHPGSGLSLQHVAAEAVDTQDTSLVSGMLTAIQDFAEDSFGTEAEDTLDEMRVGDLTVWVEQGPRALLAAVVRGLPDPELRTVLKDVLETVHLRFKQELEAFEGDPELLAPTRPVLEEALLQQFKQKDRRISPMLWGVLALLLVALGIWGFFRVRDYLRWEAYLADLEAEPGIVVTANGREGGAWYVRGLRDPLAADPEALRAATALRSGDVRGVWEAYQALDSAFVVQRAARQLDAPPTVAFRYQDGTLFTTGTAPGPWMEQARERARFVAGVSAYDDAALQNEATLRLQALSEALARRTLRFEGGTVRLADGQEAVLDALIDEVQQLQEAAQDAGRVVRLQILGHVSSEGDAGANRFLSRQRAEVVLRALLQRGLPNDRVEAIGTGVPRLDAPERTEADREANRSVSFRVQQE